MAQEAMSEFQQNLLNTQNSLFAFMRQQEQVQAQMQTLTYQSRHNQITLTAINEIPNAELRRAIGKVYYQAARDELTNELKKDMEKAASDLVVLKNTQVYVDKKAKETEAKLAELLKQVKMEGQ